MDGVQFLVACFFFYYLYHFHYSLFGNFLHLDSDPPGIQVLADVITGDVPVTDIQ